MPEFGKRSRAKLNQCDARLQLLFERVVEGWDCTIVTGYRGEKAQNAAYKAKRSKLKWPRGRHNALPSRAVDVAPWPLDWHDTPRFYAFGGYVLGVAAVLGIPIRWGGDWDGDRDLKDQKFNDLVHFELTKAMRAG